jgi:hypothetical protein
MAAQALGLIVLLHPKDYTCKVDFVLTALPFLAGKSMSAKSLATDLPYGHDVTDFLFQSV